MASQQEPGRGAGTPNERMAIAAADTVTPKQRWMRMWVTSESVVEVNQPAAAAQEAVGTNGRHAGNVARARTASAPEPIALQRAARESNSHLPAGKRAKAQPDEEGEVEVEPGEIPSDDCSCPAAAASVPGALRVQMPTSSAPSHLSPAVDRLNLSTPTSISPSAKIKELDAIAAATSGMLEGKPTFPAATGDATTTTQSAAAPQPGAASTHVLEPSIELTESERQRLERRKRRKSNWDVSDPSCARSSAFPTGIVAPLRRSNSTSGPFAHAFPRGRPFWRASSSMDAGAPDASYRPRHSDPFPPPRRGLRHSSSMPVMDNARGGAGRPPATRYNTHMPFGPGFK